MLLASVRGFDLLVLRLFVIVGCVLFMVFCTVYLCVLVLLWYLMLSLRVLYKRLVCRGW